MLTLLQQLLKDKAADVHGPAGRGVVHGVVVCVSLVVQHGGSGGPAPTANTVVVRLGLTLRDTSGCSGHANGRIGAAAGRCHHTLPEIFPKIGQTSHKTRFSQHECQPPMRPPTQVVLLGRTDNHFVATPPATPCAPGLANQVLADDHNGDTSGTDLQASTVHTNTGQGQKCNYTQLLKLELACQLGNASRSSARRRR